MKDQYIGDVGDYGKYAVIRILNKFGVKVGINWYLTKDDDSNDGKYYSYLNYDIGKELDIDLFNYLKQIAFFKNKNIKMIQDSKILGKDTIFFSEILNYEQYCSIRQRKIYRKTWHDKAMLCLKNAEVIFMVPDNGMIGKSDIFATGGEKFISPYEVVDYYNRGQDIVYYHHRGRQNKEKWREKLYEMKEYISDAEIMTLIYHKGTQRAYIFILHPPKINTYLSIFESAELIEWIDKKFFEIYI